MRRQVIILLILMITANIFALTKQEYIKALRKGPKAKITFHVVDDDNHPVTNAYMRIGFIISDSPGGYIPFKGYTDTNGMFLAKGKLRNEITYYITKEGYYTTSGAYHFRKSNCYDRIKHGKWQPWNPTIEVILREKKNPIPMYAKYVRANVPGTNEWYGYDFMAGDWVKPYGKGKVSDMQVMIKGKYDWGGYTFSYLHEILLLKFNTNKFDGVIKTKKQSYSDFFSPYEAYVSGYGKILQWEYERTLEKVFKDERSKENDCLIFRCRSKVDDNGELKEANYGKIYGKIGFGIGVRAKPSINFTYYFNPTPNDRNLEYAPGKNLLKGLSSLEQIKMYNCP